MTTHAARTVTFSASCPTDGTHDAEWSSTTDAGPTTSSASCGTCDPPPEPRPDRYLRDVDAHLRRRA